MAEKEKKPEAEKLKEPVAVPAKPEEETIVVKKSQLAEILQKIERLEFGADKGRLEHFDNANKPKELTRVRLNAYHDTEKDVLKVIMAWKMVIDEVLYESGRGYTEKQIIELTLEDDSKVTLAYRDFAIGKKRKQLPAEVISREKNEADGTEIFKVRRLEDQKEFNVDARFLN